MSQSKNRRQTLLMIISVTTLIVLVLVMLIDVRNIQGNGRTVNYAGIVRGATQRLVKEELYGVQNDSEIERLDRIIDGLQKGGGEYNLTRLEDDTYHQKLRILREQWAELKEAIYHAREDDGYDETLFTMSEGYFTYADETVSAAEKYADGIASKLRALEIFIGIDIVIVICLFVFRAADEIRQTRKLKRIAYIDSNTGLPNKRSCDEHLSSNEMLSASPNVCCLMFDLNNLKLVNDTLGHEMGDLLISSFASLLKRTAPAEMFVGRFGGDEFIGIIKDTSAAAIEGFIKDLQDNAVKMNDENSQNGIRISFAYGYAFSSENSGCTIKVLMDLADRNMYLNKQASKQGRGQM